MIWKIYGGVRRARIDQFRAGLEFKLDYRSQAANIRGIGVASNK